MKTALIALGTLVVLATSVQSQAPGWPFQVRERALPLGEGRGDDILLALIDPTPAVEAFPNVRHARQLSLGNFGESFFSSLSSGFSDAFSGVSKIFGNFAPGSFTQNLEKGKKKAEEESWLSKSPPSSKPGPEVFAKLERRKSFIKGGREKRQGISATALRQYLPAPGQNGGGLMNVLALLGSVFSGFGSMARDPTDRMTKKMLATRQNAANMVSTASELPTQVFSRLRSKRGLEEEVVGDERQNEVAVNVKVRLEELSIAHQKNWFTYLKSFNVSTLECQEWDFCKTALRSTEFSSATAKNGAQFLSYVTAYVKDSSGNFGDRLTRAVDCCLSENTQKAETCVRFYRDSCLAAEPTHITADRD